MATQQAGEQPIGMYTRVPIEAAVENWMKRSWRLQVTRPRQDLIRFVRVFPGDVAKHYIGKSDSVFDSQHRFVFLWYKRRLRLIH